MDIQTFVNNAMAASRAKTLANSDQLTLGEMILKMEAIIDKGYKLSDGGEPSVKYDFEYLFPTSIDSWRGSYDELALDYASYDNGKKPMKASEFLKMLKDAVGAEFTGYKGGGFIMSKHTPVWVANYGNSGNTAIIEIVDNKYEIIIITGWREY